MGQKLKTPKQIERHLKGVAHHTRIAILLNLAEAPGLTLDELAGRLKANFKTVSHHTHKLVQAGLVNKKYEGRNVLHHLSPYGKTVTKFIKTFQHS